MTSGRLPVHDGELFFDENGAGQPLVLLHGASLDHRMWDGQVDAFVRAGYRVIRYDARGHGQSSTPVADYAPHDDLLALLKGLEISRACLVGLAHGARTAVDFALTHPDAVDMLVLASPGVSGMQLSDPAILTLLQHQAAAAQARDADAYVEYFLRAWVDGPHRSPEQVDDTVRQRCQRMAMDMLREHASASGTPRELGATERLAELVAPVLVLVGDLDSSDVHDVAARIEADAQVAASAVIPGTGHTLPMEQAAAFNAAVVTFLERAALLR
ncbi:pimeloyl-ACP methyl ester carboxylesterase [Haloactinopolyspora alba]|uniref:Pimeloyl-ACP methyl ester carboxylesterase n=1 Tax=Haloactinopolyspora alba TaxID=648780 RepID=A0A2P8E755_9ACTN|nr:alpha/beta hydrolase [Haloactinopolyspora alba]PSL05293.1 pimeloyl-ACP methyl ester carboxylesterase [Haloactinopolyspora alba]